MLRNCLGMRVDALIDELLRSGTIAVAVHPGAGLIVPDGRVRTQLDAHLFCKIYDEICITEGENAFFRLRQLVFHLVLAGKGVEMLQQDVAVDRQIQRRNGRADFKTGFIGFCKRTHRVHTVQLLLF